MAWCDGCSKSGLQKKDIEFDDATKKLLCIDCYKLVHPDFVPTQILEAVPVPNLSYELHLSQDRGLEAKVGYRGLSFSFHAPQQDIRRLLGG